MIQPTNSHGQPSRPWLPEEMTQMNARRQRIIRRVPTVAERTQLAWSTTDQGTRDLFRQLARLGYTQATEGEEGRIYVTGVGRDDLTLVITGELDGKAVKVRQVTVGQTTLTAVDTVRWLCHRVAR